MSSNTFLDELADSFARLPGVGKKTAQRFAYHVVEKMSKDEVDTFATLLVDSKEKVHNCPICGMLTTDDVCHICSSKSLDRSKIMVLKDTKDILTVSSYNQYNGLFHSLNGLINLSKGVGPDDINVDSLINRIDDEVKEVIIATPFSPEGDTTAIFIEKLLSNRNLIISRIAFGLPFGGDIEYVDELTLKRAIDLRTRSK